MNHSESSDPSLIASLGQYCVRGLTPDYHLVIAARLSSRDLPQAGALIGYSGSQMRRRWDQVKEWVLVPIGYPPHDDALIGLWIALHREDCTALVFWLLENDSRFMSKPN